MAALTDGKVPILIQPRFLVVLSWVLGCGMALCAVWSGATGAFGMTSGMMLTYILTLWSRKGLYPFRTKQWWALLYVANFWGIELGFWLRFHQKVGAVTATFPVLLIIFAVHLVLSVFVWRDQLQRDESGS